MVIVAGGVVVDMVEGRVVVVDVEVVLAVVIAYDVMVGVEGDVVAVVPIDVVDVDKVVSSVCELEVVGGGGVDVVAEV